MKQYRLIVIILIAVTVSLITTLVFNIKGRSLIIEGQIIGNNGEMIYLEHSIGSDRIVIDSMPLSKIGEFRFVVRELPPEPTLYEIRYGWDRAPILAQGGDHIKISSLGRFATNYVVEGSRESKLLREFYQPYIQEKYRLQRVAKQYAAAKANGEDTDAMTLEYSDLYRKIKQDQLRFIITNKGELAALYALFQRLPGDDYLVNESSDMIYMQTVADSLGVNYPNSSMLKMLQERINQIEKRNTILNNVVYRNFPELEMSDMYGKSVSLSSLEGSVILIDFWSAELGTSNPNNATLKEIYKDYKERGFEVYQVGIDTSKSIWINTIQQQKLPWISVSDLRGGNSTALGLYNVTQLPANILISKSGDVVGRDLYDDKLREAVARECSVKVE